MTSDATELGVAATPHRAGLRGRWAVDGVLASLLGLATFVVHDVGYMFSLPFWTDEAWVAISTKLPLSEVGRVTASTPVGWTLLLRLVVVGGDERLRVVPLLFSALAVVAAYLYARSLPWPTVLIGRVAAVLAAGAALMIPSALARDDLKQYTADAFVTLLILWVAARLETSWGRRPLIVLGIVVVAGFLVSAVSVFVGLAAFGCLLVTNLVRRNWRRAGEVAAVGGGAGLLLVLIFVVSYRPGIVPGLSSYWAYYYVPVGRGWGPSWRFLSTGFDGMAGYLGMGPLVVAGGLVAAGVLTLVRLGRPSIAAVVPVLLLETIVLSAARQYPLFDLRTSHFLTTGLAVTAAVGVAGLCALLSRMHVAAALVAAALVAALFVVNVRPGFRAHVINSPSASAEDLATPSAYVAAHQRPGDIFVVNGLSSWGFAYYWPRGTPAIRDTTVNLQRFVAVFPDQPNILVATDRTPAAVDEVMDLAVSTAAKAGAGARIWVVHQHTISTELAEFDAFPAAHGWQSQIIIPNSLVLLTRPTDGAGS